MRKYAKLFDEVCAMIERKKYLEKLISKKENGLVKVITGIRRCGKSYLLFNIYKDYLKSMSSLEACVNSITAEILIEPYNNKYELIEQSLLLEKEIVFENGHYKLGNRLKMSRLIEKIEFLICKFSGKEIPSTCEWFNQLKQSIDFRNKLVHPKEYIALTEKQVENAMASVLETINELYKAVYKRPFPSYGFGITSRLSIL